jgi:hypothetical protein
MSPAEGSDEPDHAQAPLPDADTEGDRFRLPRDDDVSAGRGTSATKPRVLRAVRWDRRFRTCCATAGITAVATAVLAASARAALVQPGSIVNPDPSVPYVLQGDQSCTANFMFAGSDGWRYIGTAGHCYFGEDSGDAVFPPGKGAPVYGIGHERIGEFAHAVRGVDGDRDYGIVRLDPQTLASPRVCFAGGPTSLDSGAPRSGAFVLNVVGTGTAVNTVAPWRRALATGLTEEGYGDGTGVLGNGDSGAPVMDADGVALGAVIGYVLGTDPGMIGVFRYSRLAYSVRYAELRLKTHLQLLTAPLGGDDTQCPADEGTAGAPPPRTDARQATSPAARIRCKLGRAARPRRPGVITCRATHADARARLVVRGHRGRVVARAHVRRGAIRLSVPWSAGQRVTVVLQDRRGRRLDRVSLRVRARG